MHLSTIDLGFETIFEQECWSLLNDRNLVIMFIEYVGWIENRRIG
jgi:hypothetical protein